MGAFDDLIPKFRAPAAAAPAQRAPSSGAFDDLIPQQAPAAPDPNEVPRFRNSADTVNGLQHRSISPGMTSFLDGVDDLAEGTNRLPGAMGGVVGAATSALKLWGDAFRGPQDEASVWSQMRDSTEGVLAGAKQRTNPTAQPEQQLLGEAFQDAGGAFMFQSPDGKYEMIDQGRHVVLKDPATGKLMAYGNR